MAIAATNPQSRNGRRRDEQKNEVKDAKLIVGWDCGYSNGKLTYGLSSDSEPQVLIRPRTSGSCE